MSRQRDDLSLPHTGPSDAPPPDLGRLDRIAGLVFAVLIAMAALVALNSVVTARGPQNEAPVETADAGPA
ncbi:MAG: hypothetical protein CML50_14130 [Rhodobacteraceae bacterium]|jgi:hypothetical protein|uniref:Uncharacterized protein n=1 Tax=Salipiger profundus TaxID=1229727 RepID=A0A1U7D6M6_9RHOB|nr:MULTISPECIES: hypothetical protein [Salipiger]APX23710.1 hypothetical protein Ga0080559_TMP2914 [Salipiger profundus]MAB07132.1 hypothetical protein [Paracoccaceae bacterium]GGA17383.1 hypothetical protein GCM10011326_32420 [Salipiger profundus]SFD31159.1 hypothetical protein SAMN05444415_109160 [Salipiger profundus]